VGGILVWGHQDFVKGRREGWGNGCRSDPGGGGDDTQGHWGGGTLQEFILHILDENRSFCRAGASVEAFDFWRSLVLPNWVGFRGA
jgi:hypothetical protein